MQSTLTLRGGQGAVLPRPSFDGTDAGRLFAQIVGAPALIPDPDGGARYVRNPDAGRSGATRPADTGRDAQ